MTFQQIAQRLLSPTRWARAGAPASQARHSAIAKVLACLLMITATTGYAQDGVFSIQIGAFAKAKPEVAAAAGAFGEVFETRGPKGHTRYSVGRFTSRSDAAQLLKTVRASGFPDAFVRSLATANAQPHKPAPTRQAAPKPAPANAVAWSNLDDVERRQLVYLDGTPYLLNDGNFTPVSGYR